MKCFSFLLGISLLFLAACSSAPSASSQVSALDSLQHSWRFSVDTFRSFSFRADGVGVSRYGKDSSIFTYQYNVPTRVLKLSFRSAPAQWFKVGGLSSTFLELTRFVSLNRLKGKSEQSLVGSWLSHPDSLLYSFSVDHGVSVQSFLTKKAPVVGAYSFNADKNNLYFIGDESGFGNASYRVSFSCADTLSLLSFPDTLLIQ